MESLEEYARTEKDAETAPHNTRGRQRRREAGNGYASAAPASPYMEGAETHFSAYYHPSTASNGFFSSSTSPAPRHSSSSSSATLPVPGHAFEPLAPLSGGMKRKRGRPQKYASGGTTGAKKPSATAAASSPLPSYSSPALPASSPSKKLQLDLFDEMSKP